jgi:hypothetical protein
MLLACLVLRMLLWLRVALGAGEFALTLARNFRALCIFSTQSTRLADFILVFLFGQYLLLNTGLQKAENDCTISRNLISTLLFQFY